MTVRLLWAIIRPEKKTQVLERLEAEGFYAVTEAPVQGRGKQRGIQVGAAIYEELAKTMLVLAVDDERSQQAIRAIQEEAHTGHMGDGKIFVQPVDQVLTVRTGKLEL